MKLVYGRPYTTKPGTTEVRKIWGGLVPFGKVWRTGADEATLLTTKEPIEIGGFALPAGTYSLFTVPDEDGSAKLVINKKTGQWGIPYKEAAEKANELAQCRSQEDDPRQDRRPVHHGHRADQRRRGRAQDDVGEHAVLGPVHREEIVRAGRPDRVAHFHRGPGCLVARPRWTFPTRGARNGLFTTPPRVAPARRRLLLLLLAVCAAGPGHLPADCAAEPTTAQTALRELRGFRELGSVLYVAAHPDDENTQLIAYLARGRGYRTAYLSLTRGDGGQNVIGPEFFEELGVIRTQELLAARRLDGGRQFFTRAIDFGYSKNPEETLRIWDRNGVVSDIVRVIRTFRPDVVITRFSPRGGGHGHHTASAILAVEAFKLAGDPKAFPEQIGELTAWQPKRILQNSGGFGRGRAAAVERRWGRHDPHRDRRQRPGHRRAAGRHRRAQPVDAPQPGLRQLRRGRRRRLRRTRRRSRCLPASRPRKTSSTASTRPGPACPAAPSWSSRPTRPSRNST